MVFDKHVLRGFSSEITKEAAISWHSLQAGLGSGLGMGTGIGAGLGAAVGAVRGVSQTRKSMEGAEMPTSHRVLQQVGGALGGAAGGAAKGAVLGAGAGAGAGALLGAASPAVAGRFINAAKGVSPTLKGLSDFGQRQVHSVTGWTPGANISSIEQIGAGAAHPKKMLEQAVRSEDKGAIRKALKGVAAAEKAQEMGLTSVPGLAKSLVNNGVIPTVSTGLKNTFANAGSRRGLALTAGLPALSAVSALRQGDTETTGAGENVGGVMGSALSGLVAPIPLVGGMLAGEAARKGGAAAGRVIDRLRGYRPVVPQEPSRPPATEPGDTGQVATEREYGTGYGGAEIGGMQ